MFNLKKIYLILFSVFLLIGCGGGSGDSLTSSNTSSNSTSPVIVGSSTVKSIISGIILDNNSTPIEAVNIDISYGMKSFNTTTDTNGVYSISVELPANDTTKIKFSKNGFETIENSSIISTKNLTYNVKLKSTSVKSDLGSVSGIINDISGNPLSNALVSIDGQSITTNNLGQYTLSNINVGEKNSVIVTKDGYGLNSNLVSVKKDETSIFNLTLIKIDKIETFSSTEDKSIIVKNAIVEFSANSFIDENYNDYTGNVTTEVSFNYVSNDSGLAAFPGEFEGTRTDGSTSLLQSYGFFNVELLSVDGKKLNLKDGSTATLTFPADPSLTHNDTTIPLWYYDTTLGTWVEDGVATYDSNTNTYTGTVSHFTVWNLDKAIDRAYVNVTVVDELSNPIKGVRLDVEASSYFYQNIYTDENGKAKVIVPVDLEFKIIAQKGNYKVESEKMVFQVGEEKDITLVLSGYKDSEYYSEYRTINIKSSVSYAPSIYGFPESFIDFLVIVYNANDYSLIDTKNLALDLSKKEFSLTIDLPINTDIIISTYFTKTDYIEETNIFRFIRYDYANNFVYNHNGTKVNSNDIPDEYDLGKLQFNSWTYDEFNYTISDTQAYTSTCLLNTIDVKGLIIYPYFNEYSKEGYSPINPEIANLCPYK